MSAVVEMKERPIIFSGPMVKAILEGRKTQSRRVIKPQPSDSWMLTSNTDWSEYYKVNRWGKLQKHLWIAHPTKNEEVVCQYGQPKDRLYVREALQWKDRLAYKADDKAVVKEVIPEDFTKTIRDFITSQFMPRWASRITLEITSIRVERLQEISERDIRAEGIDEQYCEQLGEPAHRDPDLREAWAHGWDKINSKRKGCAWSDNPWVWVIEFTRL